MEEVSLQIDCVGTYSYANGDVYDGEWKGDMKDGNGKDWA